MRVMLLINLLSILCRIGWCEMIVFENLIFVFVDVDFFGNVVSSMVGLIGVVLSIGMFVVFVVGGG